MLSEFYQELVKLRTTLRAFARLSKEHLEVRGFEKERTLQVRRWSDGEEALFVANFSDELRTALLAAPVGAWDNKLDSADRRWGGPGSSVPPSFNSTGEVPLSLCPKSFWVFQRLE
ncbi:MAG: DUF3459 domain-containing protein [Terriglobia bacterium]|jgi:maltooligosyltrehalose trehalohydrolase